MLTGSLIDTGLFLQLDTTDWIFWGVETMILSIIFTMIFFLILTMIARLRQSYESRRRLSKLIGETLDSLQKIHLRNPDAIKELSSLWRSFLSEHDRLLSAFSQTHREIRDHFEHDQRVRKISTLLDQGLYHHPLSPTDLDSLRREMGERIIEKRR